MSHSPTPQRHRKVRTSPSSSSSTHGAKKRALKRVSEPTRIPFARLPLPQSASHATPRCLQRLLWGLKVSHAWNCTIVSSLLPALYSARCIPFETRNPQKNKKDRRRSDTSQKSRPESKARRNGTSGFNHYQRHGIFTTCHFLPPLPAIRYIANLGTV